MFLMLQPTRRDVLAGDRAMASKRQIEANRANAKRSTGPRTAAGKAMSSQNARRHSLASARKAMSENDERILRAVEHLLGGQRIQEEEITGANAQVDLWRIRVTRNHIQPSPLRSSSAEE